MGADLRGVKKRFASLMECVQPMITSQFVVWLDEKVSEFKVQGCMNFDISLDAPKWIRDYSMSMLVSGGTTPDIREDDFPPPRRGDIHSNISHRKVPVDSAHFRDQGISRISSGDSVRKRGLSSTQEEYDMGEIKRERLQEEEDDDDDDITVISASVIGDTTPRHSINSNSTSTPKYSIVPTHNVQKTTQRSLSSPSLRPVDSSKRPDLHVVDPLSSHSLSISRDISSSEYTSTSLALPLTTQVFTNIRTISTQSSSVIPNRSEPHSLKAIEFSGAQSSHSSDRDQDVNKTYLDMGIDAYEQDDPDVDEFDDPADCKDGIELIETDMPQTLDSRGLPYSPGSSRDRSGSGDGYGDMAGPSTSDVLPQTVEGVGGPLLDISQPAFSEIISSVLAMSDLSASASKESSASFICETCGLVFSAKSSLFKHNRKHTQDLFICNTCGASFTEKFKLQCHIKVQHEGHFFLCDECGKNFRSSYAVKVHKKRIHEKAFRFSCSVCSAKFWHVNHFKAHLNTHDKVKPHNCIGCGKSFAYKQNYSRHKEVCDMSVSKPVKTRPCLECNITFSAKQSLVEHMKGTHLNRVYTCVCGQSYKWRSSFNKHLKKHHPCEEQNTPKKDESQ